MYNHNKAQQSKNRVHIFGDILYLLIKHISFKWKMYLNPLQGPIVLIKFPSWYRSDCIFYLFLQYIPRNMHTVTALLCFVVVIPWLIFPYPSGLLHWHCGHFNDCPSASKATLINIDKYFMWIHYEWLHNHNKAKHNKTVCIFLGIYCIKGAMQLSSQSFVHNIAVELSQHVQNCVGI